MLGMKYDFLLLSSYFFLRLTVDLQMFPGVGSKRRKELPPDRATLLMIFLRPSYSHHYVCPPWIFSHLSRCLPGRCSSICATRMYRSLCKHGSLTEYYSYA